ncbi:MAG: DUF6702 family protein [Pseudomonadota bacterium]
MSINRVMLAALVAVTTASAVLLVAIGSLPVAHAHEQKVAITEILFNANSGNVEIAHRLYLHDAEHAVQDQWGKADLMSDPEDLQNLALYTRGNFVLWLDGQQVTPTPVGVEVDGPYIWVYDELPIPENKIRTITIDNTILRDVWQSQANLVNVEIGRFRKSAFFADDDEKKEIMLKPIN